MGYFNENSLGAITSVTTNTMDNLSGLATRVTMFVTEGIVSTAVMTLVVFLFDWRVGLLITVGLVIYYFVNHALQRRSEKTTSRKLAGDTAVVERVLEYIKGIAEVKSYSLAGKYNRRLQSAIDENAAANTDMELELQPLMLAQNAVAKLIDVGVVVMSLALYTGGHMALLNCIMLSICSFLLTEGLEQAGMQTSLLRVVDTCVDQAADILSLPAMDISGAEFTPARRDLHAEDISFAYDKKPIINGVTLDIPERTTAANVDPENEKELMEAIGELTREKTVIMIAHRLKTVRHADQILVVDKGRIVQRGTHDELMVQNGIYRHFITGREQAVGWKL